MVHLPDLFPPKKVLAYEIKHTYPLETFTLFSKSETTSKYRTRERTDEYITVQMLNLAPRQR